MIKKMKSDFRGILTWSLFLALILSSITNVILYKKTEAFIANEYSLIDSNGAIVNQLKTIKSEFNKYKGISAKLDETIKTANQKIEEKERNIRLLLSEKKLKEGENKKLIQEIDSIKNKYFDVIDSLLIARGMNKALNETLDLMTDKIDLLNSKLGVASKLKIDNLIVKPLKKSFANKEALTALAKRTTKLKICFDVMDNAARDTEVLDLYIRIISPNAEVLTSGSNLTFVHPDIKQEVSYTLLKTVDYKKEKINVCLNWEETAKYTPGLYIVEVFTKKNKLGTVTFSIK
ncbi:MAG: hypothetical protein JEZ09_05525 [Salinivirgaceae bacterium]|nr:hypothetical protein [Salinivirgaceae bacterium]